MDLLSHWARLGAKASELKHCDNKTKQINRDRVESLGTCCMRVEAIQAPRVASKGM